MWSWWCHSDITSSQAADISPSVWLCLGFSPPSFLFGRVWTEGGGNCLFFLCCQLLCAAELMLSLYWGWEDEESLSGLSWCFHLSARLHEVWCPKTRQKQRYVGVWWGTRLTASKYNVMRFTLPGRDASDFTTLDAVEVLPETFFDFPQFNWKSWFNSFIFLEARAHSRI